jgi:hypothetical protein
VDDAADGVYSRAPELEDLLKLCAAQYQVVRIADEIVVDLMQAAGGIDYGAALAGGVEMFTIQGVEIPVAGKELLIRMKDTVRPSDAADVAFLRLRIEEGRRHGKQ